MNIDEKYMYRAIQLGKAGMAKAAPNPSVGCVIVLNDTIIGEGFTSPFGGPHAEVNAINSVKDKSQLAKATCYVTLEPCSHHGKTPPCADLIVKHKIPKVVIGLQDPNPAVAGNGIQRLRASGCEVQSGILEQDCTELHKRFLTFHQKRRPYIILKWAESTDGYIAPKKSKRTKNPSPYWISNPYSRQLVHFMRSQEMAILVGTNTVVDDNPSLTTRDWIGTSPTRIVLDRQGKIPETAQVKQGNVPTIVLSEAPPEQHNKRQYELVQWDTASEVTHQVSDLLYQRQLHSVLVEGGAMLLQSFLDQSLWDEAYIFKGTSTFGQGIKAPAIAGKVISTTPILNDTLICMKND